MAGAGFVHDPGGEVGHGLPVDRETLRLAVTVLAWTATTAPTTGDVDRPARREPGRPSVCGVRCADALGGVRLQF